MKRIFVTGIGTEVGKTVTSAVLVEALKADYWKPIQSGDLNYSDSHKIQEWSKNVGKIHPETYAFKIPASPHYSAKEEAVEIELKKFHIPETENHLIIEGAGGLMVPLNDRECILDLIKHLNVPIVLVSQAYLGSINHSLLSLEMLKSQGLEIGALIFTGTRNIESEDIILKHFSGLQEKVLWIDNMELLNSGSIALEAEKIRVRLLKILDGLD
tara:strand:- start:2042 stop:2683 length:642 start_codon:yes stop_codon:yes gene_type:complete